MKINLFTAIVLLLFVESCKQTTNLIKTKNSNELISQNSCFQIPIKVNEQNNQQKASLLFLTLQDNEFPLYLTNIYLLKNNSVSIQLIADTNAIINMNEICISPDYKYIAVTVTMEGHPWIDVYDLHSIIYSNNLKIVATLNPYPGIIGLVGWQQQKLIVYSNANLILKNSHKNSTDFELFDKNKKYYYDIENKLYAEK